MSTINDFLFFLEISTMIWTWGQCRTHFKISWGLQNQRNMIVGIQSINAYYSDSTLSTPTQLWGSRSIFEMFLKMYTRSIVYWKNHVHSCKYEVFLFSLDYEPIVLRFFLFIIFKILKWNIFQCYYLKILTYVLTYVLCFH